MIKLGFADKWVSLFMRSMTSVNYSFCLNHSSFGKLYLQRGLRQGDPLSPYLFVPCAPGLSYIFSKAVERRLIRGVKVANSCPVISHLFFADDSLIFFKVTKEDNLNVRNYLNIYEKTSRQMVNFGKSVLSFSPSSSPRIISIIEKVLSVPVVSGHDVYLGLPTFSLRNKKIQFRYILERITKKIQGWSSKLFSMSGRAVLIKSVIQAIPSYAMSCYRIPASICRRVEQICANFWWKGRDGNKGSHWLSWLHLYRPKCLGGMGFRNVVAFNKAMLAKQIWRVVKFPNSLMA